MHAGIPLALLCAALVPLVAMGGGVDQGECMYSRKSNLIPNVYDNAGDSDFPGETAGDTNAAIGDSLTVTLDSDFSVLSSSNSATKTLTIYDNGKVSVWETGMGTPQADFTTAYAGTSATPRRGFDVDQSFFAAAWFANYVVGTLEYYVSAQHIKRSEVIVGGAIVKSKCTLERIEAILSDCAGGNTSEKIDNYQSVLVEEAVVITFKYKDVTLTAEWLTQVVFAVTKDTATRDAETKVIYLYEAAPTPFNIVGTFDILLGYMNGQYETAAGPTESSWQSICGVDTTVVHLETNCDCGAWNAGVYVFDAHDFSISTVGIIDHECTGEVDASCTDVSQPHFLRNKYCRPATVPVDTCREELICKELAPSATGTFDISLTFRDEPKYTGVIFIDSSDWSSSQTITKKTDAMCQGAIANGEVVFTFDIADIATCDIAETAGALTFTVLIYDVNEATIAKDGYRVLMSSCNYMDLPHQITDKPEFQTFATVIHDVPADRTVALHINPEQRFSGSPIANNVDLGEDLFLIMCYEEGSNTYEPNAEPYGAWPSDCMAGNTAAFDDLTHQIIDSSGCKANANSDTAFYIPSEFMESDDETTRLTGNSYEWCISSGAMQAVKWIGYDTVYIRCKVNLCYNEILEEQGLSKCEDACNGQTEADFKRKKRDVSSNNTQTVTTSFTFKPNTDARAGVQQRECTDPVTVMTTLSALIVVLLFATSLAVVLFFKLRNTLPKKM